MWGVQIIDYQSVFIGEDCYFDTNYPEDIVIGKDVCITSGCKFITHYMNPEKGTYTRGKIEIGQGAYVGMNSIICKPIKIGKGAIIGAGSIVTKDVPEGEIWAGNPAKFIKKNPNLDWRIS